MKRLMLGFTMATVGAALFAPAAQAAPTLTMHEARIAASDHTTFSTKERTYGGATARSCSRLASNRVRCSTQMTIETRHSAVMVCRARVEVVENAEIKARTLRSGCKKRNVPYLTYERASHAASKAMDPLATNPDYEMGFGGGGLGKNRYLFEATWVTGENQTCLQTARVRLVKQKVLVNVSEIACVDDPDWP